MVEGKNRHGLEGGHLQIVRLLAPGAAHRGVAQAPHPLQPPLAVLLRVVVEKHFGSPGHVRRQVDFESGVARPVARSEDLHRKLERTQVAAASAAAAAAATAAAASCQTAAAAAFHAALTARGFRGLGVVVGLELLFVVHANAQVAQHAFHFAGELGPAPLLQLGDHELFVLVGSRALVQEPLRQLVAVNLREQVLM